MAYKTACLATLIATIFQVIPTTAKDSVKTFEVGPGRWQIDPREGGRRNMSVEPGGSDKIRVLPGDTITWQNPDTGETRIFEVPEEPTEGDSN